MCPLEGTLPRNADLRLNLGCYGRYVSRRAQVRRRRGRRRRSQGGCTSSGCGSRSRPGRSPGWSRRPGTRVAGPQQRGEVRSVDLAGRPRFLGGRQPAQRPRVPHARWRATWIGMRCFQASHAAPVLAPEGCQQRCASHRESTRASAASTRPRRRCIASTASDSVSSASPSRSSRLSSARAASTRASTSLSGVVIAISFRAPSTRPRAGPACRATARVAAGAPRVSSPAEGACSASSFVVRTARSGRARCRAGCRSRPPRTRFRARPRAPWPAA